MGLALQLTNILRDVREDAEGGRTYLPADDLAEIRLLGRVRRADSAGEGSDFAGLVHFEVRRARTLFAEGYRLLPMLDRRSGACVAAMAGIYRRLLDRIEREPEAVLRGRVSLPGREKAYVAVRGLSGLDTRHVTRAGPSGGAPDGQSGPR
ncbi:squalene/phytoene synthase family protein [Streptomyces sp. L7]